jgi:hypothetical protein
MAPVSPNSETMADWFHRRKTRSGRNARVYVLP